MCSWIKLSEMFGIPARSGLKCLFGSNQNQNSGSKRVKVGSKARKGKGLFELGGSVKGIQGVPREK
ncbi:hypothetical protein B0H12DRAFT_1133977 [Mycena haematopus]|nr:hypothetical protein B0H12DRAFT_1133977 [Mycena haematopus]